MNKRRAASHYVCAIFLFLPAVIAAQPVRKPLVIRPVAPAESALYTRWSGKLSPTARIKLSQAERTFAQRSTSSNSNVGLEAQNAVSAQFPGVSGADIEALAFIVLMNASKSSEDDLKSIMDGVKAINAQKDALRSMMNEVNKQKAANANAAHTKYQSQLDSLNNISEMTSMRLQMAMDRRDKFIETLSNIFKKIESTSDAIIQNMK